MKTLTYEELKDIKAGAVLYESSDRVPTFTGVYNESR